MQARFRTMPVVLALLAAPVGAQLGWNREAASLTVLPGSGPGLYDVQARWTFQVQPSAAPLDLGATLQLSVNRLVIGDTTFAVAADPNALGCGVCGRNCGSGVIDGVAVTLLCDPGGCGCGPPGVIPSEVPLPGDEGDPFEGLTATFPDVALTVGDQLTVALTPLATAVPELDTSDDGLTELFAGFDPRPGDADGDDDGDLLDAARFQVCFGTTAPVAECRFADHDGDGAVDDGDLGPGLDITGPVFPCSTIGFTLRWPMLGQDARDWVVNNYNDLDPVSPGSSCGAGVRDYAGGGKTYNGHSGIDVFPPNFRAMDGGVVIVAARDGRVEDFDESRFDRNIVNSSAAGNFVKIRHPNGFQTRYWHFRKDSITPLGIYKGKWVNAGEAIGVVGSSGNSSGCHLHFGVRDCDGNNLDAFDEALWFDPPVYSTPLGYMDMWLKAGVIVSDAQMKDPTPDMQSRAPFQSFGIGLYTGGGQPGESLQVRIVRGDGTIFEEIDEVLAVEECRPFERRWWNRVVDGVTGIWSVQVRINGQLRASKSFQVSN